MKVAVYSTHRFEEPYLAKALDGKFDIKYLYTPLSAATTPLCEGCQAVSVFVNDDASAAVLQILFQMGIKFLVLRSAGYNNVDVNAAKDLGIRVARVPEYSPFAVAEHTVALMLALNRKLIRAHNRVMDQNFALDGLVGFDMHGKTAGIIGGGKIGQIVARILYGFGCQLLVCDKFENEELKSKYGAVYTDCMSLCEQSDIITLHAPLTPETKYLINKTTISRMKTGVMLINTSRGALIDTKAVIRGLKTGKIGHLGLDVYEEEGSLFFEDHSEEILMDDVIARLMSFSNVLITSHQGFLTDTALKNIAETTAANLDYFGKNIPSPNEL